MNRSELRGYGLLLLITLTAGLSGCGSGTTSSALTGQNLTGPQMTSVQYVDVDGNGVDDDDIVVVTFDDTVTITSTNANSFEFRSSFEGLGTGAQLSQSVPMSQRVEVTLGNSPMFFAGSSIFDVKSVGSIINIRDLIGTTVRPVSGGKGVVDVTATAPTLTHVRYNDADLDGTVNVGDTLFCEFDKPISIAAGSTVANNFALAVTSDSYGAGATLSAASTSAANRGVVITLGTSPVLTVAGTFDSGTTTAGSASNVQVAGAGTITITDTLTAGANNITASTSVDLGVQGETHFRTTHPASLFVGNQDATSGNVSASSMWSPGGVSHYSGNVTVGANTFAVDLMFVADTSNNRVLIFEDKPTGNNADATVVLGQADFDWNSPNRSDALNPSAGSDTMSGPQDVQFHAASNQLFVADSGNHRVIVFDDVIDGTTGMIALSNGDPASIVLGQTSMGSSSANQGFANPTGRTLSNPTGLHVAGGQVAVADTGNNRVMIWGSVPASHNAAASTVLGQTDFLSSLANQGGAVSASTLSGPEDVFLDPSLMIRNQTGGVLVADTGNNRVLLYATGSPTTGVAADVALGQGALTASAAATTAAGLDSPTGVGALDGGTGGAATGRVWVADRDNHRVMVYTFDPAQAAQPATADAGAQIGQAAATGGTENRGNANVAPSADSFAAPARVDVSESAESNLLVADRNNHRVLDFTTPPTADIAADIVHGHGSFTSSSANDHELHKPTDIVVRAGQMIVADSENNRVLIYNTVPTSGSPSPDVVVGQANFNQTLANQGATATAATLNGAEGVATDGTNLVIADTDNNRVLVFTTIPAANGASANFVLGQASATASLANNGGISAATMDGPTAVWISATQLFVCDSDNHRVLVFNNFASLATGASANVVLGQEDFSSRAPNHGDIARGDTLHTPSGVRVVGSTLFVCDTMNNRVLGWLAIPTLNGESADFVMGQGSFLTTTAGTSPNTMTAPTKVASDGVFFNVADSGNHRILHYRLVPRADNTPAKRVFGQSSFSSGQINSNGAFPSASSFYAPNGMFYDGTDLWICDEGNSRLMRIR